MIQLTTIEADADLAERVLTKGIAESTHERSYWKMFSCRHLSSGQDGQAARVFRMDPTKEYEWGDDELSQMVKTLVDPFLFHYDHLTRVELLIQKPGTEVYCHTDKITGQIYEDGMACPPRYKDVWEEHGPLCKADPWQHKKQHYLGGRLALGPQGRSYFMESLIPPEKIYYATQNLFFFLQENLYHGAEPVDFWRGVVFFDGIHNPDVMKAYYCD